MRKISIIVVIALVGFIPINAQELVFTDTQFDDLSEIYLSEIDGLTLNSQGQTGSNTQENEMKFGVIGGLVSSTLYGDEADSFDSRLGFHIGVMGLKQISDEFAIQAELCYAAMGSDYKETFDFVEFDNTRGGGGDITGTIKLDYLILLVVAKYYVAQGLSLEAGPQVGFLLSAKNEFSSDGFSAEEDVKDETKGLDVGVSGGVGYEFDMGLYLKARYYLGLTEVNDFMFPGNESWKNSALFASAGFFFN